MRVGIACIIRMHIQIHEYVRARVCVCMYVCMYVCVRMYVCIICNWVRMHAYTHACMHVLHIAYCMHIRAHARFA